ncbi:MAG TPA: hypothetical protein VE130_07920 [Nitrososphaeraceae archaeon]|nr:hypothetical protein [Nitrososphaeraceae archaeon]
MKSSLASDFILSMISPFDTRYTGAVICLSSGDSEYSLYDMILNDLELGWFVPCTILGLRGFQHSSGLK